MKNGMTRRGFNLGLMGIPQARYLARYHVVVIGAGVFGAWIAYECRRRGWSVLLLDSRGPANSMASSGGESRILRVGYGPQTFYSRWALRSLARWREVLRRTPALILQTGVLWLGPKDEPYLRSTIQTLQELGVRQELLDADSLNAKYSQLHVESPYIGILEVDSCTILARRAVNAVVEIAVERGVEYRTAYVMRPDVNGRLTEIKTGRGDTIRADHFVFACGPWLPKVFPEVVGDQIQPTRQEEFYFAALAGDTSYAPDAFPSWVDFRSEAIFYGCSNLEYRGIKVAADAHGKTIDPDTEDRVPSPEGLSVVRRFLRERFPRIESAACVGTRVCQYENSTSGDFLIDRHPYSPNVWIVGGGSGHGFKHGPAVGDYVASLLAGGPIEVRFTLMGASKQVNRAVH